MVSMKWEKSKSRGQEPQLEYRTDGRRQTTDDRRQTTDDRRQTTDDRRQTTDDRRQTTDEREVLEWKAEGSVGARSLADLKTGVTAGDLACSSACLRVLHGFELP